VKDDTALIFDAPAPVLHGSAEFAARADPVRLGGKLGFGVEAGRQGPKAILTITVEDEGGSRLSRAQAGQEMIAPAFVLSQEGKEVERGSAEYGCDSLIPGATAVAVPTGTYDVALSVDLSPVFEPLAAKKRVEIVQPGPNALDRRLKEIATEEGMARIEALRDLRFFPDQGERIVAALLPLLDDPDLPIRSEALSVITGFPEQALKHLDRFLALAADETREIHERGWAARFLAWHAPIEKRVEDCLAKLAESSDPRTELWFRPPLQRYRQRQKAQGK
jgi:hypothetical protein